MKNLKYRRENKLKKIIFPQKVSAVSYLSIFIRIFTLAYDTKFMLCLMTFEIETVLIS